MKLKNKESTNSSYSYHTTSVESFKITYSVVEWYSEDSTSNEGTSCVRKWKEEEVSSSKIFESRNTRETWTSGRNKKELSSNEDDEVCLKTTYEVDTILGTKSSYEQLFRINTQLLK